MKGPYQIRRERFGEGYRFKLYRFNKGRAVIELGRADISSPIAPKWLRDMQAKLNTKATLDGGDDDNRKGKL